MSPHDTNFSTDKVRSVRDKYLVWTNNMSNISHIKLVKHIICQKGRKAHTTQSSISPRVYKARTNIRIQLFLDFTTFYPMFLWLSGILLICFSSAESKDFLGSNFTLQFDLSAISSWILIEDEEDRFLPSLGSDHFFNFPTKTLFQLYGC